MSNACYSFRNGDAYVQSFFYSLATSLGTCVQRTAKVQEKVTKILFSRYP